MVCVQADLVKNEPPPPKKKRKVVQKRLQKVEPLPMRAHDKVEPVKPNKKVLPYRLRQLAKRGTRKKPLKKKLGQV